MLLKNLSTFLLYLVYFEKKNYILNNEIPLLHNVANHLKKKINQI